MNPNIMKLLEDDEDDTIHSGADVEAFAAALNRHIEGETSTSPPSISDAGLFHHESNSTPNQVFACGQDSNQELSVEKKGAQNQNSSEMEIMQHVSCSENQEQQVGYSRENHQLLSQQEECKQQWQAEQKHSENFQTSEQCAKMQPPENLYQDPTLQKLHNEHTSKAESDIHSNRVSFGMILPVVLPHLDKDRSTQLIALYTKLRKNEIHRDVFVRNMRNIVGDPMLKQAMNKLKMQQIKTAAAQNSQNIHHQIQVESQTSSQQQQHVQMTSISTSQITDSHPNLHPCQKGQNHPTDQSQIPTAMVEVKSEFSCPTKENNVQNGESESQSASQGTHVNQGSSSLAVVNQKRDLVAKQGLNEKQSLHLPQTSYPMYGASMSNYHPHPYSGQSVLASSTSLKPQSRDSQARHLPITDSHPNLHPCQKGQHHPTDQSQIPTAVEVKSEFSCPTKESNVQKGESETQSASQETHVNQGSSSSLAVVNQKRDLVAKQGLNEKQSLHLPQTSYPMYGASMSNYHNHPYSGQSVVASSTSLKPQSRDSQARHLPVHPQGPPVSTSLGPQTSVETPSKKPPLIGQKKPFDAVGMTSSLPSKKQKVSGASLDQTIRQLSDVTAVSGVDIREEEEQLLSNSKEGNRVSEATRRVVQEEEEKLILQKVPFQKKMAKIMSKCGIENISKDVEHCLSLCLEERLRGVISNLIRVSKQRVDIERSRHRTIITSDIRRQILAINRVAKDDWEKKQAVEAEKLRKINEVSFNGQGDGADGDEEESRPKNVKGNKDVDDKMRTSAANVAARVAVGGDDMLSKWQLMAEQARKKREGVDSASGVQMGKDVTRRASSTTGRISTETRDGARKKFGRNPAPHTKVVRTISAKDVVSVLEREPQMSKSVLLYRLYAREHTDSSTAE